MAADPIASITSALRRIALKILVLALFLFVFWVVAIADVGAKGKISNGYGIVPRDLHGFYRIPLAPFIHNLCCGHVLSNSGPFLAAGGMIMVMEGISTFIILFTNVALLGGLCVWVIGKSGTIHRGASGVVFGLFGYILAMALATRNWKASGAALLLVFLYGGALAGLFPHSARVSWESHLSGFVVGAVHGAVHACLKRRRQMRRNNALGRRKKKAGGVGAGSGGDRTKLTGGVCGLGEEGGEGGAEEEDALLFKGGGADTGFLGSGNGADAAILIGNSLAWEESSMDDGSTEEGDRLGWLGGGDDSDEGAAGLLGSEYEDDADTMIADLEKSPFLPGPGGTVGATGGIQ